MSRTRKGRVLDERIARATARRAQPCTRGTSARARRREALNVSHALAAEVMFYNDEGHYADNETPEQRWTRMRAWVAAQIADKEGYNTELIAAMHEALPGLLALVRAVADAPVGEVVECAQCLDDGQHIIGQIDVPADMIGQTVALVPSGGAGRE